MRSITLVFLLLASGAALVFFFLINTAPAKEPGANSISVKRDDSKEKYAAMLRLKQKASNLKTYVERNRYNSKYCFLIDMKLQSGKNRFFVYNLQKDSVEMAGLVTHGSGSGSGRDRLSFSNIPNSNCTSLGKYKVGRSYMGRFGLAYKLHGLDVSNDRAFERFVVLHAHSCVPTREISPQPICESQGCPTVAPAFLTQLKRYIDASPAPVLLSIYY
jgi:L,D-transpeptidase catalytic domain